ncbi:TPA: hypothetical protein ACG1DY_005012 [Escherichia coli]
MKIADHLNKDQKDKLNQFKGKKTSKKKHSPKKKKEERVDWVDIMGMNRDRYTRGKGGAMRRR